MSPKQVECVTEECSQDNRIAELEALVRDLKGGFSELTATVRIVVDRIGHQRDSISGKDGSGIVGTIEQMDAKLDALQKTKDAPARYLRWIVAILPAVGAAWWVATHVRIVP